jgi:hypothetical protein
MTGKRYRCLIGVEKNGLIWAGTVAEKLDVPLVYYSLELCTDDFERLTRPRSIKFKRLRQAERAHHRRAAATIVQDPERAQILLDDNGVSRSQTSVFYLPVSVRGRPYDRRSRFFHETFGLPGEAKIILCFGLIAEERYAFELAEIAQLFPDDWFMVMHGVAYESWTKDKIKAIDRRGRVILSLQMVPNNRLPEVVASADIGLALYTPQPLNDRLTAFSSEKMALYMQCGVPFVS